jgi:hypothetical protein
VSAAQVFIKNISSGVFCKDGNFGTAQLSQAFKLIASFVKDEATFVTLPEFTPRALAIVWRRDNSNTVQSHKKSRH